MSETYNKNNKISSTKIIIFSFIVLIIILAVAAAAFYFFYNSKKVVAINPDLAAVVGGKNLYLKDYNSLMFAAESGLGTPAAPAMYEPTKAIKEPVMDELVDLAIIDTELAKRNITISEADQVKKAQSIFKDYGARDAAAQKAYRDYARLILGKARLQADVTSWKEGYALFCYFDRADQDDMRAKPAEAVTLRAKQKVYAKQYCTDMKSRLEAGQSTYKDELAKLSADPVIGGPSWKPYMMPFGLELAKDQFAPKYFHPAYDLFNRLSALSNTPNQYYFLNMRDKGATKDAMYAVVYIKNGHQGETFDFDQWLKGQWSKYQVKTYLENIKI